jgi:hypothetical protein
VPAQGAAPQIIVDAPPDQNIVELRLILAADCPKVIANKITDLCGVIYLQTDRSIQRMPFTVTGRNVPPRSG